MKADQDRVRMLITQTITMLCKKGLEFETELKVQGLLGVTIDSKDIFLIHLNEKYDTVSDTKDVIQRQDSVATSTGNEKSRFSPDDVSPDAGLGCGSTLPISSGIVKKEPEPLSPTFSRMENQPTFTDLHDSMTDFFPYSECQTTENPSALLGPEESRESGFLMDIDHSMSSSNPSGGQGIGKDNQVAAATGVIMLDSGDEGDDEERAGQFEFNIPHLVDSKSNLSMLLDDKMNVQAAYSKHDVKPNSSEGPKQYNSEAEFSQAVSQSWALQPFSRSLFPSQSPGGRAPFQNQQGGQFSPERFAPFSLGMNRPAAIQSSPGQNIFPTRGTTPRRSPAGQRQPRPTMTPGRAGMLSPMSSLQLSPGMRVRCTTGSGLSIGSSSMSSPPVMLSPAMMRGSPRTRRARGSPQMQRGASASASASSAMVPFVGNTGAVMRGGGGGPRMSRGSSSVRTRTLDGYSYGKQTVTNYICNLCQAVYKNHSSLLTHQVKVHGRQKKEGKGRPKMLPADMYEEDEDDDDDEDADMDSMGNM